MYPIFCKHVSQPDAPLALLFISWELLSEVVRTNENFHRLNSRDSLRPYLSSEARAWFEEQEQPGSAVVTRTGDVLFHVTQPRTGEELTLMTTVEALLLLSQAEAESVPNACNHHVFFDPITGPGGWPLPVEYNNSFFHRLKYFEQKTSRTGIKEEFDPDGDVTVYQSITKIDRAVVDVDGFLYLRSVFPGGGSIELRRKTSEVLKDIEYAAQLNDVLRRTGGPSGLPA